MATDASPYNVSAMLMQELNDGCEHIVTSALRKRTAAKRNYSQIERDALWIVWFVLINTLLVDT